MAAKMLVRELAKMELLQGCAPQKRNLLARAVHSVTVKRSSSLNARPSRGASTSVGLTVNLGESSCSKRGVIRRAVHTDIGSPPVIAPNLNSSSGGVLSSVIEAHDLTLLQPGPWRALDSSDPVQNEEAEEAFKVPLDDLRAILHLSDIDNSKTDYYELLVIADYLERLGLDLYFRQEIKSILDGIFRIWTESSFSKTADALGDLQGVSLAFYLLRSHQYNVQPNIFQSFRNEDGSFWSRPHEAAKDCAPPTVPSPEHVATLLTLLRASDLRFPSDEILEESYRFASSYLRNLLDGQGEPKFSEKASAEVRYRLNSPWVVNPRMMETRQTISNFHEGSFPNKFSRLSPRAVSLMLRTATQLLNDSVSMFQQEIQDLQSWSKESGLQEVNVRDEMVMFPCYVCAAYDMPQAKYAYAREVYAKSIYLVIILDDLYDYGASMEHLVIFTDAFRRRDASILDKMPNDQDAKKIKIIFKELYDVTASWAKQASIWYGSGDLLETFLNHWVVRLEIYLNERRWADTGYNLTLDEYLNDFAKWSFACETAVPFTCYATLSRKLSRSFFETRPDVKVLFSIAKTGRFLNDTKSYQHEQVTESRGKKELVGILMDLNPELTLEGAFEEVDNYARRGLQETTEEILCSGITDPEVKTVVLINSRMCLLLYYTVDGLRNEDHVIAKLMEPLPTPACN